MAYSEELAEKVKAILKSKSGFDMKKMFGGICFLLHGNMAWGVLNSDLIVRVGPKNYEEFLKLPETKEFDITGKPMKGWVMVSVDRKKTIEDLELWVERGANFALELPKK